MLFLFFLPLAEITFLTPPPSNTGMTGPLLSEPVLSEPVLMAALLVAGLVGLIAILRAVIFLVRRRVAAPKRRIIVDGSNVMHWKDETPQIATVAAVVRLLQQRGFEPGVVFDANAGYKLAGRHMNDRHLGNLLGLPADQILVVPKGTQADPFILSAAREFGAPVVSRDRFRDWAADHPEVNEPGFLIRGGYHGSGELWLDEGLTEAVRTGARR